MQDAFAPCDTTEQFNAHNTDTRKGCYSWHPWYGHTVTIRASLVKRNRAIFRCQLEPTACVKSLEIPQWMFDPVICAAMRRHETPVVNGEALWHLKALLAHAAVGAVVQRQSHCMNPKGETDATHPRSSIERSTRPVPPASNRARLANVTSTDKAASRETSSATVSRASTAALQCRRTRPGGGR